MSGRFRSNQHAPLALPVLLLALVAGGDARAVHFEDPAPIAGQTVLQLNVPGETSLESAGYVYRAEILKEKPGTGDVYRSGESAYFDFDDLALPLKARNWREGDKFIPFGLKGTKKVHDVFIDEKVPVSTRTMIPLVCDANGVIWVTGVRRADRARVTDKTNTIVKLTFSRVAKPDDKEAGEQ